MDETDGHVDGILRELAIGLIPEREAESAWAHLQECSECADGVRVARSLYETALEDGVAHIDAEKLVAHVESGMLLSRVEQLHLGRCEGCRGDLEVLEALPGVDEIGLDLPARADTVSGTRPGTSSAVRPGNSSATRPGTSSGNRAGIRRWLRWWTLGGAVAAATASAALLLLQPARQIDTTGLAEFTPITPIEVRVPRGSADAETFEGAWLTALGAYSEGRYAAAESGLRRALALDPEHGESWLLLGSTLLLQGRDEEAGPALAAAEQFARGDAAREEARWQSILASLAAGSLSRDEYDRVLSAAELVAAGPGKHAREAEALVSALRVHRSQ